jgi:triosephosphate isomerase (TIM)
MATKKKFTIVGNWKMNPDTLEDAKSLFSALSKKADKESGVSVIIAPPYPFIAPLAGKKNSTIALSVQDVSGEPRGAYTGSVSASQAKSAGAAYAIIGHSERRAAGDTGEVIVKKSLLALEAGLKVILCVGESARDEHAEYLRLVREQVVSVLAKIDKKKAASLILAYEPVWAIGKSFDLAPKPRDVHEMAIFVKCPFSTGARFQQRTPKRSCARPESTAFLSAASLSMPERSEPS